MFSKKIVTPLQVSKWLNADLTIDTLKIIWNFFESHCLCECCDIKIEELSRAT